MKTPSDHPELYDDVKYRLLGFLSYNSVVGMKEPDGQDPNYYDSHAYNACVHIYDEDNKNLYWIKEMAMVLNADMNVWDDIPEHERHGTWYIPRNKKDREDFRNGIDRFLKDFKAAQKAVWRHVNSELRGYLNLDGRNSN